MSSDLTIQDMPVKKIPLYCGFSPRPNNKYSPQQEEGVSIKARRLRQIEKGMIKVNGS